LGRAGRDEGVEKSRFLTGLDSARESKVICHSERAHFSPEESAVLGSGMARERTYCVYIMASIAA
jgi:hypothetical protein